MGDLWYCPNMICPSRLLAKEAYSTELPGRCPYCNTRLSEEIYEEFAKIMNNSIHTPEAWAYCQECETFSKCIMKPTLACSLKKVKSNDEEASVERRHY